MNSVVEMADAKNKNKPQGSINNKSSEKDNSFCEPVSEQDLE